jgi:ADP-ribose pyrophosphatase YjhB (NUDIX family)
MKTVIDLGYVKKESTLYSLTTAGERYADRVELETFTPRIQPKIVTMIFCQNKKGEILLFRRTRSPLFNRLHLPYGKIHMGEKVTDAAHRELKEKTGLTAKLSHAGDIYVRVYYGENLVGHILHHIFRGVNVSGQLIEKIPAGTPLWANTKKIPQKEFIAGFKEIIQILSKNKKKTFFKEFDLGLPKDYLRP